MKTEPQTLEQKILSILNPVRVLSVDEWMRIADILEPNPEYEERSTKFIQLISRFESLTRGKWVEPDEVKYTVGSQFCEMCSPYTWGNNMVQQMPDIQVCVNCGHEQRFNVLRDKVWQPALLTKEHFVCGVDKPTADMDKFYSHAAQHGEESSNRFFEQEFKAYQAQQAKIWFEGFEFKSPYIEHKDCWFEFYDDKYFHFKIKNSSLYHDKTDTTTVFDFIYHLDLYNRTAEKKILINWSENFIKELLK